MIRASLIGIAVMVAVFWVVAPAAPQAPQGVGAPFVKSVGHYQDWQLTQPIIDTAVEPGMTIYTKIVFSEPMELRVADDDSARPVLYCQVGEERIRYRIARHGASGADFVSGNAKPLQSGTDDYICKYTIPEGATGELTTMVGKLSADTSGNTMESFYTDSVRLTISNRDETPAIVEGDGDPNLTQLAITEGGKTPKLLQRVDTPVDPETIIDMWDTSATEVYMPDENLRKAVVAKINEQAALPSSSREVPEEFFIQVGGPKKPSDPIYAGEMRLIGSLRAVAAGIESLIGLEYATNLRDLRLGNGYGSAWEVLEIDGTDKYRTTKPETPNRISDLGPLENLKNLKVLGLECNAVSNLLSLSFLENLQWLSLVENKITDISPLAELTNLGSLDLSNYYYSPQWAGNNRITNLYPLGNLKNLHALAVAHNPIGGSIDVVRNLPKLNFLGVGCCGVSNLRLFLEHPRLGQAGAYVYLVHSPLTEEDGPDIEALLARGVDAPTGVVWTFEWKDVGISVDSSSPDPDLLPDWLPPLDLARASKTLTKNHVERCSESYRESLRAAPTLQLPIRTEPDLLSSVWHDLSHVPEETALLPNYPNPFNPETWIPYQLATPAEVRVAIHAADGRLIRTVALGYQAAGVYKSKGRAAYWDGYNAQGEPVASGVYFYTFSAGDFTTTRKMVIMK